MMYTAPDLRVTAAQIEQLSRYCAQYRSDLWLSAPPTPERNQVIRCLQALQARLEQAREQEQREHVLVLSEEEQHTLKHLLTEMLRRATLAPASPQRTQQMAQITELLLLVGRTFRPSQRV
jgi:hypothetical protein